MEFELRQNLARDAGAAGGHEDESGIGAVRGRLAFDHVHLQHLLDDVGVVDLRGLVTLAVEPTEPPRCERFIGESRGDAIAPPRWRAR